MPAIREKDSSDFDLELFIELFDEALTSDDPNVQKTLQHLMVIVALARNHAKHDHREGPMRRLFDDQRNIIRRLERLEHETLRDTAFPGYGPVPTIPTVWPGTTTQWPPAPGTYPPGTIFGTTSQSVTPPNSGAQGSSTDYAWDSEHAKAITKMINGGKIAEHVDDLLKDHKYKGSSLNATAVKLT